MTDFFKNSQKRNKNVIFDCLPFDVIMYRKKVNSPKKKINKIWVKNVIFSKKKYKQQFRNYIFIVNFE